MDGLGFRLGKDMLTVWSNQRHNAHRRPSNIATFIAWNMLGELRREMHVAKLME
jgi:hypothetical protein